MNNFKPSGYSAVSPYFVVKDAESFLHLTTAIFDARLLRKYLRPDGSILHAELQIEDSVIMVGDATEEFPAVRTLIHVYVPDVDKTFSRAKNAGCNVLQEPMEREGDSDRRATFEDFAGNVWSIGTQFSHQKANSPVPFAQAVEPAGSYS